MVSLLKIRVMDAWLLLLALLVIIPYGNNENLGKFSIVDDVIIFFGVALCLLRRPNSKFVIRTCILLLVFLSFAITFELIKFGSNLSLETIFQIFLLTKFFSVALFICCLSRNNLKRFFFFILLITCSGIFLQILGLTDPPIKASSHWLFSGKEYGGFFIAPNKASRILSFSPFLLLISNRIWLRIAVLIGFVSLVLTGSKSGLLLFIGSFCYVIMRLYETNRTVVAVVFLILGGIALPVVWDLTRIDRWGSGYLTSDQAPLWRIILLVEALKQSWVSFPFGAGICQFLSPCGIDGTVLYNSILAETFFYKRSEGLFDSGIATIIGELGYLLAALYFLCCYLTMRFMLNGKSGINFSFIIFVILLAIEAAYSTTITLLSLFLILFALSCYEDNKNDQSRDH